MRLRRTSIRANRRRGIILLVVLVMLTLFAIAGLTFVLYADAASESAGINRDAESIPPAAPDMDPTAAFNLFLGQLIYGVADPDRHPTAAAYRPPRPQPRRNHVRRLRLPRRHPVRRALQRHGPAHYPTAGPPQWHGRQTTAWSITCTSPADGFVHDPSRPGTRANPGRRPPTYTGGQNPPYTYPDTNSMFLASINQTTGQVTMPSFHRPWLFGSGVNNPNWTNAQGKYLTLRLRPADMGPGFPRRRRRPRPQHRLQRQEPRRHRAARTALWIDIGAPELYTASGLRYKMLVAPLILDLDNRINLNVVGNVFASRRPATPATRHVGRGGSQHEPGAHERAPPPPSGRTSSSATRRNPVYYGRYGPNRLPASVYGLTGTPPHVYAPADLNGVDRPRLGRRLHARPRSGRCRGRPATRSRSSASQFPPQGYGNNFNGIEIQNASTTADRSLDVLQSALTPAPATTFCR